MSDDAREKISALGYDPIETQEWRDLAERCRVFQLNPTQKEQDELVSIIEESVRQNGYSFYINSGEIKHLPTF